MKWSEPIYLFGPEGYEWYFIVYWLLEIITIFVKGKDRIQCQIYINKW